MTRTAKSLCVRNFLRARPGFAIVRQLSDHLMYSHVLLRPSSPPPELHHQSGDGVFRWPSKV